MPQRESQEKIHLNSQIAKEDLSAKMGISRQHCSVFLSKYFNEFMNRQRVFEAQKILHDEKYANLTMATIGEMYGFNSIASWSGWNVHYQKLNNTVLFFRGRGVCLHLKDGSTMLVGIKNLDDAELALSAHLG